MDNIGTLSLLIRDDNILLALVKEGFGKGKWNGFGGKLEPGEDIIACSMREVQEESGLIVHHDAFEEAAEIDFFFAGHPTFKVFVFLVRSWEGEVRETAEMKPRWFPLSDIPYDRMWAGDRKWMPLVLSGKRIKAEVFFTSEGDFVERFVYQEISE